MSRELTKKGLLTSSEEVIRNELSGVSHAEKAGYKSIMPNGLLTCVYRASTYQFQSIAYGA